MPSIEKIIDFDTVDRMLQAHCDGAAIARLIGVCPDTLYNRVKEKSGLAFSDYASQKRQEGVSMVVDAIFKDALLKGGSDRIFWLKNKAGWKDQPEYKQDKPEPPKQIKELTCEQLEELKALDKRRAELLG